MNTSFIVGIIKNELLSIINKFVNNIRIKNTTDIFIHATSTNLEKILTILSLQTHYRIKTLNEITVVDFPYNQKNRFQCVYILSS
jgi:NADH:ubiquinone oxidoreductase subunit C